MNPILAIGLAIVAVALMMMAWQAKSQDYTPLTVDTHAVVYVWCENVSPFWDKDGNATEENERLAKTLPNTALVIGNCVNVTDQPPPDLGL